MKKHKSSAEENAVARKRARVIGLIRALPAGKVSSYGAIATAAGWPGENGAEQRFRLRMEGVTFRGLRVDMKKHEFQFSKKKTAKGKPPRKN
jgi:alkylated DNA nucleotide flippase Atl1